MPKTFENFKSYKEIFEMSPFEFLLSLESAGKKMTARDLSELISNSGECSFDQGLGGPDRMRFFKDLFSSTSELDCLFLDPSLVEIVILAHRSLLGACFDHWVFFDGISILSLVAGRRPGIILGYYVKHFPELCRRFRNSPNFGTIEEFDGFVLEFVRKNRDKPGFPKEVSRKIEEIHSDFHRTLSFLS